MKELLVTYYKGFAQKANWEQTLDEDFVFIMNDGEPLLGKQAYVKMCRNFCKSYQTMRVNQTIIEGDNAFVLGNYDWILPDGSTQSGNVAEIWKAENGLLKELKIYFHK
ncbi:nuclear transport factor 2 family protein [Capnocytophaga cynodegmi]|uniref:SnoaL-like domain-containing protein n=1 Tax=Capnocytophaga cynodegmi TaxID=28189 RepID=A0A0B7H5M5_9FLAO|nr:DUF4440 domain-containing protein [Capnocytophaga cynodegmi]CEN33202.1 conserved hypothetical protein [Capnocytophaga cynodegmi]